MAATIIAKPNQSMQDLVLMACGTMDGAIDFCLANNVRISDVPVVGRAYQVPAVIAQDEVILTELQQNGIVIGTLNPDPVPVTGPYSIILYPMMDGSVVFPGPSGGYELVLADTGSLIHINSLLTAWPRPNHMMSEHKDVYETDMGSSAGDITPIPTLQTDREVRYFIGAGVSTGHVYMWWAVPDPDIYGTVTYKDVAGWRGVFAPLALYYPSLGGDIVNTLIGTIDLSFDSVVGPYKRLKLEIGHTPITVTDFNIVGQGLAYRTSGTGIWITVPELISVGDTVYINFTPGVYDILLKTAYMNDDNTFSWPTSYLIMVIEVF
jgi:hypothetical protein